MRPGRAAGAAAPGQRRRGFPAGGYTGPDLAPKPVCWMR
jgi:hypothetical protein